MNGRREQRKVKAAGERNRLCPSYGNYGDLFQHKGREMNHSLQLGA